MAEDNQQAEGSGLLQDVGSFFGRVFDDIKNWFSSLGGNGNNAPGVPTVPPEKPATPDNKSQQDGDALDLEMMSPLRGKQVIEGNIADTEATVGYIPKVYKVDANTPQTA